MTNKFSVPRGTTDILPDEIATWQEIEVKARRILSAYGYKELRTPIFEEKNLFVRSLGQTSDVVQKQMFNIASEKKDGGFSLRPEGTASIVRAYIEHNFDKKSNLVKFYYIGPMFRGERPQKGRLRQFHHIGVEAIGISEPFLDAEVIALSVNLLKECGLENFKLKINSLGTAQDKQLLSEILRDKLKKDLNLLCQDCQDRFKRNIFRILDCKNEDCKKIVSKIDIAESHLSKESKEYFSRVKEALGMLKIPFEISHVLVRGLDYYTHTVFEISHGSLGSQDALGAGGRYNNLVGDLGGPQVGAVGFALGIERMILAKKPSSTVLKQTIDIFLVALGDEAYRRMFLLLDELRQLGLSAEMNYESASIKSQMRLADKLGARLVLILGEDELKEEAIMLKVMETGQQEKVPLKDIKEVVKNRC